MSSIAVASVDVKFIYIVSAKLNDGAVAIIRANPASDSILNIADATPKTSVNL